MIDTPIRNTIPALATLMLLSILTGCATGPTIGKRVSLRRRSHIPTSEARNPCAISRKLRELLRYSGIAPPYLLVGHSFGGLDQFCFAMLFPQDVAGLVLLDPTHPDHWERMKSDAPTQAAFVNSLRIIAFRQVMRQEFDDQADSWSICQ